MSETAFVFAHPELARMLWVWAAVIIALIWLERRGSDALDRLVSTLLQDRLVLRPSRWRRWARIGLLAISGFSMIVALMQPQWGLRYVATPRVGAEIMIALDVSRSMLADDAKPSRLERAKAEISDLLSYLDEDYVGLIAFAGRATILSPMTPDKSFLRLALDRAGAHSVTRGGTRLAEPIRRAVAGMGEAGPAQRALILITDGEDHDSFALDAARAAAEAGIKIITIGFGDESGSQIYLRDPKTGARTLLRDGDGLAVLSRLDGDLLREIALMTDGAFVPAGTGVLDLASIYEAHIAGLTRGQLDENGRTIRDEAYQFPVLLAIICLIAAVSTSAGSRGLSARTSALMLGCLLFSMAAPEVEAQATGSLADNPLPAIDAPEEAESSDDDRLNADDRKEDPRQKFNRANSKLTTGDVEAAELLFRDARREATDDVELRYAATYNLGMASVARADALQAQGESAATEALDALYVAADWFREAAAAKPDELEPRHNLDVTLRRALILADEIAQEGQRELEDELDLMIDTQRQNVQQATFLLEEVSRSGELDAAEMLRPAFRDAATAQRLIRADANTLAERISREREVLLATPEAERTPEDVLRSGQLEAVLAYLDGAIDRMGQTRRQFRQRRAERAYRRGARALSELKRARDQLRSPVELIGILLSEVGQLATSTHALSGTSLGLGERRPAFLTAESVEADGRALEARVNELSAKFSSAAEQLRAATSTTGLTSSALAAEQLSREESDQEFQRRALIEASPLVDEAAVAMARVSQRLADRNNRGALESEVEVAEALAAAQEQFFELRQLLNAAFEDESRVAATAETVTVNPDAVESEFEAAIAALQEKNLRRALRLEELLEREESIRMAEIESEPPSGPQPGGESAPTPAERESQRFDLARQRLALASGAMMEVMDAIRLATAETKAHWRDVGEASQRASGHLDAMRTLFFSIAEHVRKLALDQGEVHDQTQDAIALSIADASPGDLGAGSGLADAPQSEASAETETGSDPPPNSGVRGEETKQRTRALANEQGDLEARANEIADALVVQAEEMAQVETEEAGPDAEAEGIRIRQAAEFVASAGLAMVDAFETLKSDTALLDAAPEAQTVAIADLQRALELLSPPSPPPDESESDDESGDQSQESEQGEDESESEPDPQAGAAGESEEAEEESMDDPSQLLQGVRDREAARRRDQEREQQRRRSVPVEKDW